MGSSVLSAGLRRLRGVAAGSHGSDESDEQLLDAFTTRRDEAAFAALVRRHGSMVLGVCRRVLGHQQDAEDAFQATFLVLAQSAVTLRRKAALAGFLHGTAHRIALAAKRAAARRRKREGQAPTRMPADPSRDLLWREVQAWLDEEIARLPDIYRSVFVLCCLESLSQAETARRLGLKEGTASSRLAEARKRLQLRLSRRGVELTALLAATALATPSASALPAIPLTTTTQAALSPAVVALANNGSSLLSLGKAKLTAALVLAMSILSGASLWVSRSQLAEAIAPPSGSVRDTRDARAPTVLAKEAEKTIEIRGRVLGPDGQPKDGAKLLIGNGSNPAIPLLRTRTGSDGRFSFHLEAYAITRAGRDLLATADGCGTDWIHLDEIGGEVILRLPSDEPIHGQVLDLEGRPVAGAAIHVASLATTAEGNLDDFLRRWRSEAEASNRPLRYKKQSQAERLLRKRTFGATDPYLLLPAATTDAHGQFTLHGVGRDRTAELRVSGAGRADTYVNVVARADFRPDRPTTGPYPLYGPRFTLPVGPDRPITGIVRDQKTDRPVAGARIDSGWRGPSTTTDAEGKFRLAGLTKRARYRLYCQPQSGTPYLPHSILIADAGGIEALSATIELTHGISLSGRVFNKTTGRPAFGHVRYKPREGNHFAGEVWDMLPLDASTDAQGRYQLAIPPGPGLLVVAACDDRTPCRFLAARVTPADRDPKLFYSPFEIFRTIGGGGFLLLSHYNAYRLIDPKPDAEALTCDFPVDPGRKRTGKLVDAEGRPVKGAIYRYLPQLTGFRTPLADATFTADALDPGVPSRLLFEQSQRGLVGTVVLRGDEPEPVVVHMEKTATVTGRLLDPDGKPLAGLRVYPEYPTNSELTLEHTREAFGEPSLHTDAEGRFRIEGILPGFAVHVQVVPARVKQTVTVRGELRLKAGEVKELGDCRIKLPTEP